MRGGSGAGGGKKSERAQSPMLGGRTAGAVSAVNTSSHVTIAQGVGNVSTS